jgi:hypothetical protein
VALFNPNLAIFMDLNPHAMILEVSDSAQENGPYQRLLGCRMKQAIEAHGQGNTSAKVMMGWPPINTR